MLDVINSVGLSSSVLKMIERRHKNDLYLALGGMVGCAALRGVCQHIHGLDDLAHHSWLLWQPWQVHYRELACRSMAHVTLHVCHPVIPDMLAHTYMDVCACFATAGTVMLCHRPTVCM